MTTIYTNISSFVFIIIFFLAFWKLNVWYNRKHGVSKTFQWFPKKIGVRKVSEHLSQLNKKLAAQGKGIWVMVYAVDLYVVTIPLVVRKYRS
ncbi:hypothetical protein [Ectobacillus panaciterrae]|uniref:hypothetical protein n=1 Tax=Ectobacillus panaciterrae TaxID=363872 RepID=UPI00040905B2|nr:hypothetical protein [Ectobacillus panaciterrae]